MEDLGNLLLGFSVALTPVNLFWCLVGVILGTMVGVLPGLGPAATIAMLLPLTLKMDHTDGHHRACGYFLRRALWRLDYIDPFEHTWRVLFGRDLSRRLSDGASRKSGGGAGNFRHRFVRRGDRRRARVDAGRAASGALRVALCSARVFRLDGFGAGHGRFLGRRVYGQSPPSDACRSLDRDDRHGSVHR